MLRSTLSPWLSAPREREVSSSLKNSKLKKQVMSSVSRFEKALRYNGAQIELWKKFVNFAVQYHYLLNSDEEKAKLVLERAADNVGQHMQGGEIWNQFIDFELALNHMGFVNLLGFIAIKTPLLDSENILAK